MIFDLEEELQEREKVIKDKDEQIRNQEIYQEQMNAQLKELEEYGHQYIDEQFRILREENE